MGDYIDKVNYFFDTCLFFLKGSQETVSKAEPG
jgi:hypothetical protein